MTIAILSIATLIIVFWLILLGRATEDDYAQAAYAAVFDKHMMIKKLIAEDKTRSEKLQSYEGFAKKIAALVLSGTLEQKTAKLHKDIRRLKERGIKGFETFIIPGYVLQREAETIGKSGFRKMILTKCFELYGKKYATRKSSQLVAKMISYPIIGFAGTLILGVMLIATDKTSAGYGILSIGICLDLVLAYGVYDELCDSVNKRHRAISRQIPGAISKLALLVTSGMIMDRAWKETAYSQDTDLYMEMRKTSQELDNLVSPEVAYGGFINRCNTKETAKLASAIMQNQSKGNAEIGKLLKDMAREVWLERRHTAKRDAEKANSKLMIPTMLLFLAILVMLMVPIAMNFSVI